MGDRPLSRSVGYYFDDVNWAGTCSLWVAPSPALGSCLWKGESELNKSTRHPLIQSQPSWTLRSNCPTTNSSFSCSWLVLYHSHRRSNQDTDTQYNPHLGQPPTGTELACLQSGGLKAYAPQEKTSSCRENPAPSAGQGPGGLATTGCPLFSLLNVSFPSL